MGDDTENTEAAVETHNGEVPLSPRSVLDTVQFGRRLRAARIISGFDRVTEFTAILRSKYGIDVSDRTVYAIERGEQMPHLDFFFAVMCILDMEPGYYYPAIRPDVLETWERKGYGTRGRK